MYKHIFILALMSHTIPSMAQSESGLLLEAEAEKKLSKKVSVALEADMRTRNDFKTMDRWSIGIGGEYKPVKYLKLGAGYTLLNTNFREDISYKADGNYNNWRPSYWGVRHRFNVSASGTYKFRNNLMYLHQERISSAITSASPCASDGNTPTVRRNPCSDGTSTTHGGKKRYAHPRARTNCVHACKWNTIRNTPS